MNVTDISSAADASKVRRLPGIFAGGLPRFFLIWVLGVLLATGVFRQNVLFRSHTFYGDFDSSLQSYAWNTANAQAIREGSVKLWDFTTSSGTSFAGEMQTAPFYPANWLFAWLASPSSVEAQEWRLIAHFGLLFAGAYALLRHNRRGRAASATGAILTTFIGSFALRSGAQPNIFESLSHLPLVVWLAQRAMESAKRPWRCGRCWQAGAACGIMILAGHMQPPIHAGMAVALLCLFLPPFTLGGLRHRSARLLVVAGVALLVALPQVIATGEYLALSYRWIGAAKPTPPPHHVPYEIYAFKYVLQWSDFSLLFDSRRLAAEGSTLFVGFGGLALVALGCFRPDRFGLYGLVMGALAVLIALGDHSIIGKLSYYVPGLNTIRTPVRTLCLYHLGAGILAAAGVDILLARLNRPTPRLALCLSAIPALTLAVEAAAGSGRHMQSRQDNLYPKKYYGNAWALEKTRLTTAERGLAYRFMALPNDALPPNLGNVNGGLSIRGHRATMQMRYFKYLGRDWSPAGESFRRLGLRYVFSRDELPLPPVETHDGITLYESPDALSVFQIADGDSIRSARLDAIEWSQNQVRLSLSKGESGRMVFAQVQYPGWIALIDGERAPLLQEDAFIATDVPAGARELVFAYRPWWLVPSVVLSLCALAGAALSAVRSRPHFST